MFGLRTGLWDDGARPTARAPRPLSDTPERQRYWSQVGPRSRSFEEIMRDVEQREQREQEEREQPAPTRRTTAAPSPRTELEEQVLLSAAARGWTAEENAATTISVRLHGEALWRAVVRCLSDADLNLCGAALKKLRVRGTVLVDQADGP